MAGITIVMAGATSSPQKVTAHLAPVPGNGQLLARPGTSDVVDAHGALTAATRGALWG